MSFIATMKPILQNLGAGTLGLFAGCAVNMSLIVLNTSILYPLPDGVSMEDTTGFAKYVASLPVPAFLVTFAAHYGQAAVGSYLATKMSTSATAGMISSQIIGALTMMGTIVNLVQFASIDSVELPKWIYIEIPFFPLVSYLACHFALNGTSAPVSKAD
jgi:hypothetical protein